MRNCNCKNKRIYQQGIEVETAAGKNEYRIEEKSIVEGHEVVELWVHDYQRAGKTPNNLDMVNDKAIFDSAYITLQEDSTKVIERIPLSFISAVNKQGRGYKIGIKNIQVSESRLFIPSSATPQDSQAFYFVFGYIKTH